MTVDSFFFVKVHKSVFILSHTFILVHSFVKCLNVKNSCLFYSYDFISISLYTYRYAARGFAYATHGMSNDSPIFVVICTSLSFKIGGTGSRIPKKQIQITKFDHMNCVTIKLQINYVQTTVKIIHKTIHVQTAISQKNCIKIECNFVFPFKCHFCIQLCVHFRMNE